MLFALVGVSWLVPLATGAMSVSHPCLAIADPGLTHQATHQHGSKVSVPEHAPAVGSHECAHCSAQRCSQPGHCALTAPVALASAPAAIEVVTTASLPALWMRDRPLSANPTPPIPPPQPVL
jgi:hypothetical protein